jgi:hypothetical protein
MVAWETIIVTRFGPYLASITRPSGPFVIALENHSRLRTDKFSFRIKPQPSPATDGSAAPSLFDLTSVPGRILDYKLINPLGAITDGVKPSLRKTHTTYNSRLQMTGSWDALYDNPNYFLFIENSMNYGGTANNGNHAIHGVAGVRRQLGCRRAGCAMG